MAIAHLNLFSSSSTTLHQCRPRFSSSFSSSSASASFPHSPLPFYSISYDASAPPRSLRVSAVTEEAPLSTVEEEKEEEEEKGSSEDSNKFNSTVPKPCQLYVCNIPRSCDDDQLQEMFKPFGAVKSIKVARNNETGISKGVAFVTMSSISGAIAATIALDGSDVGGREMRVKLTEHMEKKKNVQALKAMSNKAEIFETPHKLYVGNLAWSVKVEDLKEFYSQYGNVVSARLYFDRSQGKSRVYAFVSFSSQDQLKSAASSNGTELQGRKIVARNAVKSKDPKTTV